MTSIFGWRCPPRSASCRFGESARNSGSCVARLRMNPDFVDLLRAFVAADVRFLVVGAYALALHGRPRATGDLDVWVDATSDFAREGVIYQIGLPPGRIDILTELTGISFADAWDDRLTKPFGPVDVAFIGRDAFVRNKRATGPRRILRISTA